MHILSCGTSQHRSDVSPIRAADPWEPEKLGHFLDRADRDPLGAAFQLLAATGLRRGEALGLDHGRLAFGRPKTSSGEDRIVDLDPHTIGVLIEHRLRQDAARTEWGAAYNDHKLVFAREDGSPIPPDRLSDRIADLIAEIGLRRIRLHDPRHGQASLLLAAGVDIVVVSKRLGHSSVAITSDTYTHLLAGVGKDAAERAWALVPRGQEQGSKPVREQSVSNLGLGDCEYDGPADKTAGHRPRDGAASVSRTLDLRITSASLCRLS